MKNVLKLFFFSLALEIILFIFLSYFPGYTSIGFIGSWASVVLIPLLLFQFQKKILHAKYSILPLILSFLVFVPVTVVFLFYGIGLGKGPSVGYHSVENQPFYNVQLSIIFFLLVVSMPAGISLFYYLFNRKAQHLSK